MAYDVPQLLGMSQAELDALFTASDSGPIPAGEADGTAIIAPGTTYSPEIASFIKYFAWQGKVFDPTSGTLKNRIGPFGLNAIIARVYKAPSWLDGKECVDLGWFTPSGALDAHRDGEILLVFPTIRHLEQLGRFSSVDELLAYARERDVQPIEPKVIVEGEVARVLLPGDPGY